MLLIGFLAFFGSCKFWMRNCKSKQRVDVVTWFHCFLQVSMVLDAKLWIQLSFDSQSTCGSWTWHPEHPLAPGKIHRALLESHPEHHLVRGEPPRVPAILAQVWPVWFRKRKNMPRVFAKLRSSAICCNRFCWNECAIHDLPTKNKKTLNIYFRLIFELRKTVFFHLDNFRLFRVITDLP